MKTLWRPFLNSSLLACSLIALISCGDMAPTEDVEEQAEMLEASDVKNDTALKNSAYIEVYPKGVAQEDEAPSSQAPSSQPTPTEEGQDAPADAGDDLAENVSDPGSSNNGGDSSGNRQDVPVSDPIAEEPAGDPIAEEPAGDPIAEEPVHDDSNEESVVEDRIDVDRHRLVVDQASSQDLIQIRPKEGLTEFAVGKHPDFREGAYQVFARWSLNDQVKGKSRLAVQINLDDKGRPGEHCNYDDTSDGDWRSVGVFYLSHKAKIKIKNNKKQSAFIVEDSLMFVPVTTADVTKPEKFRCLDGQIDGFGLRAWR
ncbi:MAG: hypothetical protein ACOH5I_10400 [Oligoflexus sp.]